MADPAQQTNSNLQSKQDVAAFRAHMERAIANAQHSRAIETFEELKDAALSNLSELADFVDDNNFEDWTKAKQAELISVAAEVEKEVMYVRVLLATHTGDGSNHARPGTGGRCRACVGEAVEKVEARVDDPLGETTAGEEQT